MVDVMKTRDLEQTQSWLKTLKDHKTVDGKKYSHNSIFPSVVGGIRYQIKYTVGKTFKC